MDNWERAAFFPYLFAPLLLSLLMLAFTLVEGGQLAAFLLVPVLLLGYYTFFQIVRGNFGSDMTQFLVSGGTILYTVFFPYLILLSNISEANFTLIYIVIILPTFLGHVYSLIYFITRNLMADKKPLIIEE